MLFDDAAAERETEPRTLTGWLGGEEGLEDFGANLGGNPWTSVSDFELDLPAPRCCSRRDLNLA